MTRLGECSPSHLTFVTAGFFNNRSSPNFLGDIFPQKIIVQKLNKKWVGLQFGRFFSTENNRAEIEQKMGWVTFWAI
jgi:hypothetical protein